MLSLQLAFCSPSSSDCREMVGRFLFALLCGTHPSASFGRVSVSGFGGTDLCASLKRERMQFSAGSRDAHCSPLFWRPESSALVGCTEFGAVFSRTHSAFQRRTHLSARLDRIFHPISRAGFSHMRSTEPCAGFGRQWASWLAFSGGADPGASFRRNRLLSLFAEQRSALLGAGFQRRRPSFSSLVSSRQFGKVGKISLALLGRANFGCNFGHNRRAEIATKTNIVPKFISAGLERSNCFDFQPRDVGFSANTKLAKFG